ncbi:unnamed protein product, partial [Vitis vinifera]
MTIIPFSSFHSHSGTAEALSESKY